jgi:hypothetical protein
MADPASIGVSMGLNAIGGIMGANAASKKAAGESQMFAYKAAIARKNAEINRKNADFAFDAGEDQAQRSGMTTGFTIASQKAAQSGSGFDVNRGTAADVRDSTQSLGLRDQKTIRIEAGRKAWGYKNAADMNDLEASMNDQAGANARKAGEVNMWSTLLGSATSVADKWFKASNSFGSGSTGITTYDQNFQPVAFTAT